MFFTKTKLSPIFQYMDYSYKSTVITRIKSEDNSNNNDDDSNKTRVRAPDPL